MWINYDIWSHSGLSEGHINLRPQNRQNAFLTMSGTKLIANDWVSAVANSVSNTNVTRISFIPHESNVFHSSRFIVLK